MKIIVISSRQFSPKYQSLLNIVPGFITTIHGETQFSFMGNTSRLKQIDHFSDMKLLQILIG